MKDIGGGLDSPYSHAFDNHLLNTENAIMTATFMYQCTKHTKPSKPGNTNNNTKMKKMKKKIERKATPTAILIIF